MDTAFWLVFLPACFALNMAPGPNNLLSLSNATRYGLRRACLAGSGRLFAFAIMIALAGAGLAVVLQTSLLAFTVIKLAGAAYLFYLAWQLWRSDSIAQSKEIPHANLPTLMRQEFLVAIGNPKAILIFTAFLPQFVNPQQPAAAQFLQLGICFLLLEWVAIFLYAYGGLHMQRFYQHPRAQNWFNRSCAGLLGAAGVGLLVMRKSD